MRQVGLSLPGRVQMRQPVEVGAEKLKDSDAVVSLVSTWQSGCLAVLLITGTLLALPVAAANTVSEPSQVCDTNSDGTVTFGQQLDSSGASTDLTWRIKVSSGPNDRKEPGDNLWAEQNVCKDSDGNLHLYFRKIDGVWQAAELFTTESLGYGTYTFDVMGRLYSLNANDKNADVRFQAWWVSRSESPPRRPSQ